MSSERLQIPLPHETSFNTADNPYTSSEFFKICEDYGVPKDPVKYRDEKFYWTYQHGVTWPNDCIGPDSDYREFRIGLLIRGFYRCWVVQNIRECQSICIFNSKFSDLPEIWYSWEYCKCSDSSISLS